jgi:hypothetical protein
MYFLCFKNKRYDFLEQQLPIVVCNGDIASCPVKELVELRLHSYVSLPDIPSSNLLYFSLKFKYYLNGLKLNEFCSNTIGKNDPRY